MKIPKTIKLAGFTWSVVEDPNLMREEDMYGCTIYAKQQIRLDANLPPQKKEQTFIHELMHAVFWQFGVSKTLGPETEEAVVNSASFGMYHVLKDNGLLK